MESKYSWEDFIGFSVLLNTRSSSFKTQFLPVFHLVLLKFTLSSAFVANCPKHILMLRSLWFSLYLQLCSARTDPQSPEMIHIYFECIRHLLYSSQRKTFTLEEHYHSDLWQKTQKASKKRKHQKEIFYCCTPNMKGKPKTNENWPPAQYMDKAKDYLFVPFESPLEEEPQEMKSLEESWKFFAGRSGACLGKTNQAGFDSALWTKAIKPGAKVATPVLFLFENKLSKADDKFLEKESIRSKVNLVRGLLNAFNDEYKHKPLLQIEEQDVVLVFPIFRNLRDSAERLSSSEWGGTLVILERDHLINNIYHSMRPFMEISTYSSPNEPLINKK